MLTFNNNFIGELWLDGIPPVPNVVPENNVCFDIDCDGILGVLAIKNSTRKKTKLTVKGTLTKVNTGYTSDVATLTKYNPP